MCAYSEEVSEIDGPVKEILNALAPDEELIVATDLFGGSVNNEFMKYISRPNVHLIAGVNLPLLLELVTGPADIDTLPLIENAISSAREQILYCNRLLDQKVPEDTF